MAANIFDGSTDSNWGTAANWSLNAVPTANDGNVATFDGTSPACTVNTSARVCNAIDFTNYTNTITFTNNVTASGSVTLGASMSSAGAGYLIANATGTLTSNGKTWTTNFALQGTSQTYTLADNWAISGLFNCNGTTATTIQGAFTITCSGGFSQSITLVSGTASMKFTAGTWTSGTAFELRNNLEIAGNITLSTNVAYGSGILLGTSGTISGGILNITRATTLNTTNITWTSVTLCSIASGTITLQSDLNLSGLFTTGNLTTVTYAGAFNINCATASIGTSAPVTLTGNITATSNVVFTAGTTTINGAFIITVGGNLTVNTAVTALGTASIVMNGTGILLTSGTGVLRNSLTFNTAGTITISSALAYNTGTLTYVTGTVNVSANLTCALGTTFNTGTMNWLGIIFAGGATYTLSSALNLSGNLNTNNGGAGTVTFSGAFNIAANNGSFSGTTVLTGNITLTGNFLALTTSTVINGASFTVSVAGNVTLNSSTVVLSGTSKIIMNGTGSITMAGGSSVITIPFEINTSGTITLDTVNLVSIAPSTGAFVITSVGSLVTTGSTYNIGGGATITINVANIVFATILVSNVGGCIFNGSNGFTCGTFNCLTANNTLTWQASNTYIFTTAMTISGTAAQPVVFASSSGVTQSIIKLNVGATQNNDFCSATRIDSSSGQTIYSYRGTLTTATNWRLLIPPISYIKTSAY